MYSLPACCTLHTTEYMYLLPIVLYSLLHVLLPRCLRCLYVLFFSLHTVGAKEWEWERPKFETVVRRSLGAGSRCPINQFGQYIKTVPALTIVSSSLLHFDFTSVDFKFTAVQLNLTRLNGKQLPVVKVCLISYFWMSQVLYFAGYKYSCMLYYMASLTHLTRQMIRLIQSFDQA